MVRQRFSSPFVVGIACLGAGGADAAQPSAAALETQAQGEFAKVGTAVRERLNREAAGDLVGARIAREDADAHRYRYLDIQRAISRLSSPSVASPSVAAPRNPFLPDASFLAPSASSARGTRRAAARQDSGFRPTYPAWDMYRPHAVPDLTGTDGADQPQESRAGAEAPAGRSGDLYLKSAAKPEFGERAATATNGSATASPEDPPREPFLVYRERLAGSGTRE